SLLKDFFDAAHGNRRTGDFRNALAGFPERSLHRCLDHALLQLIRERACWQLQSFIQRMDARGARPAVAHSLDLDGAKDGLQHASMQAPSRSSEWATAGRAPRASIRWMKQIGRAHV